MLLCQFYIEKSEDSVWSLFVGIRCLRWTLHELQRNPSHDYWQSYGTRTPPTVTSRDTDILHYDDQPALDDLPRGPLLVLRVAISIGLMMRTVAQQLSVCET
jgi:hypothetical protein